jgi:hypothetical protein
MQQDGRPQEDADRLRLDSSRPKDQNGADIIEHHRRDQSSTGAALRIAAS